MKETLTILIADHNRTNLSLMDMLVRKLPGYSTELHADPLALEAALDAIDFDIAILDYRLQGLNGVELMRRIRAHRRHAGKPVMLLIAADEDSAVKAAALETGVSDFLQKPIEPVEFRMRISNLARLREGQSEPARPGDWLSAAPGADPGRLRISDEEIVSMLARATGYKDRETPMHTTRVACYAAIIAHHLGLSVEACADIRLAAPLHDIGKVGLRDEVLQKRGFLSEDERVHMAEHSSIGHAILAGARSGVLQLAAEIALTHHERWDGSGYPNGLRGTRIPLSGRITAVADVFDALTSLRPYKTAWTLNNAFNYLHEQAGLHFDPACVAALEHGREEVAAVMSMMPDHTEAEAHAA